MSKQTYTLRLEADSPPNLMLGQCIGGAQITALEIEPEPEFVSAAWVANRFEVSKSTVTRRLCAYNVGSPGKHLYNRETAISVMSAPEQKRRGRKRVN